MGVKAFSGGKGELTSLAENGARCSTLKIIEARTVGVFRFARSARVFH